jgi:Tfp pilus assembly PilM family ATPase
MAKKIESITGMSVTADAICMARMLIDERQIGNISIQPVDERSGDIWESAAPALKQLVRAAKLGGENVVCSLPGEFAVIRRFSIEAEEPDAEAALEWEFCQNILGPRDEFTADYEEITPSPEPGRRSYLMAGYRSEAVESIKQLAKSARLNPAVLDLDVFAIINVYEANYREGGKIKPAMCVLADYAMSKCILTADGRYVDMEIIRHSGESQSADTYASMLEKALARLIACNPGFVPRTETVIMLSGSLFSQSEFTEQVKSFVPGAETLYPFRTVKCGTGMPEEQLRKYSPYLAVAVGLALRGGE